MSSCIIFAFARLRGETSSRFMSRVICPGFNANRPVPLITRLGEGVGDLVNRCFKWKVLEIIKRIFVFAVFLTRCLPPPFFRLQRCPDIYSHFATKYERYIFKVHLFKSKQFSLFLRQLFFFSNPEFVFNVTGMLRYSMELQ